MKCYDELALFEGRAAHTPFASKKTSEESRLRLTTSEAAARWHASKVTVGRRAAELQLPRTKVGREYCYDFPEDFDEVVLKRRQPRARMSGLPLEVSHLEPVNLAFEELRVELAARREEVRRYQALVEELTRALIATVHSSRSDPTEMDPSGVAKRLSP